ncbi:MAG: diguanylate cyclase [Candidatus Omnitrophica bacterium]|nr:diguanylate cyclase [Candidatus Omnitrophota bacterium]
MSDGIKILLVEDNEDHAFLAKNALLKMPQCSVSIAPNSARALELLNSESFSIILSDYVLPDGDGIRLLQEIKKRGYCIPFVMVTGQGNESIAATALKEGADDYLVKSPGFFPELPHTVKNVLSRFDLEEERERLNQEIIRKNEELVRVNQKLSELAIRDGLTGVFNHRHFQEHLELEFARAKRYHLQLSCMMLDLDFFKAINDKYSHQFGDEVLKELAQILQDSVRQVDFLARYGGEEFVVLLPETGYTGASVLAERILRNVAQHVFQHDKNPIRLTVSVGVSSFPEDKVDRKDLLVELADRALYKSKSSGRNQVSLYGQVIENFSKELPQFQIDEKRMLDIRNRIYDITETVRKTYVEATKAMIAALEAKDPFIREHSEKVSRYSALIAQELNLAEDEVLIVEHAALLHDIGKICIDNAILLKPGPLTVEEYAVMKEHSILGYKILNPIKHLREELPLVLYHHEWYDGNGYPHGLKGHGIPLGSRVIAVADAFVTMTDTCRLYRKTVSYEGAVKELIVHAGTQFDPRAVEAMVKALVKRKEIGSDSYDKERLSRILSESGGNSV